MPTVKAMTITIDSLPPRPKCGYNGGYDVAVKGPSIVVVGRLGLTPLAIFTKHTTL
jgi:hypothetical protein